MKKFYFLSLLAFLMAGNLSAQTYGHLNVSIATSETGGNYAPRNIVAVWIENENGDFVKTLLAYAQNRKTHLNIWQASTAAAGVEFNDVDAITGPTRTSHSTRECLWNGLDYNQNLMPDGTYSVWMELTDKNGTGNYTSFSFTKGPDPETLTPDNAPSFSNILISWEPSGTGILEEDNILFEISNNPGNGIYQIKGAAFDLIEVYSMNGSFVLSTKENTIDITNSPEGMYLIKIFQNNKQSIKKVLKTNQ